MSTHITRRAIHLALGCTLCVGLIGLTTAQVRRPTQSEKETAPVQFRAQVTGESKFENYEKKTTPEGVYPSTGPHDFSGAYTRSASGGGGGPGGPGGPPPGGAGGPPPGGAPGGGAGGPPAGGMGGGLGSGKPGAICVPSFSSGFPGTYPTHIFMTKDRMTIVQEENHRIRRIYIDGEHQKSGKPSYGGDSIAHWDGDTLVVETINIKGQEGQTLVERIKKVDGGRSLEIASSTNGGAANTTNMAWRPDLSWVEDICEDFGEAFGEGYL